MASDSFLRADIYTMRFNTPIRLNLLVWIPLIFICIILVSAQPAAAKQIYASDSSSKSDVEDNSFLPFNIELEISGGYRNDDLDWNVAGDINGKNPNIISELTWEDLESYQVKVQGRLVWPRIIALRGSANYGWIFDGQNQDSDYHGDDRSLEFSRSNNSTDDGNVWDAKFAVGYPIQFGRSVVATIFPLVGYSHHEQQLNITDGYQTVPPKGPFPGLDSTYDARWRGPWVGIDMHFKTNEFDSFVHRFETYFTFEYHWADYDAEADWNLREDFAHPVSFEQEADGNGYFLAAGINFVLNRFWALNLNLDYQDWWTDDGSQWTYGVDGTVKETRLNEVNWSSYALSLGIAFRF